MKRVSLVCGISMFCLAFPLATGAQTPATALAEAQARLVCGTGTVVNATYLPGGLLRATCRANVPRSEATASSGASQLPAPLEGTALVSPAAAGAVTAVVVASILLGGDDDTATTTTTTTTTLSGE